MTPFAGATATAGDLERDAVDNGMDVTRVKIEAPIEQSGEPGAPMPVYYEHLARLLDGRDPLRGVHQRHR